MNLNLSHTQATSFSDTLFNRTGSGKRCGFSCPLKANRSGGIPAKGFSVWIGNGDDCVVESGLDMANSAGNIAADIFFTLFSKNNKYTNTRYALGKNKA